MKKVISICLLSFLVISCQDKEQKLKRTGERDVLYVQNSDQEMNAAIKKAKETFSDFQTAFNNDNPDYSNFSIKQKFDTSDGGGEHIWIGDLQSKEGGYYGIVQNVPVDVAEVKLGDSVKISPERLSDWMYQDKNLVKGGYTIKVLRNHMTPEEKKEMDAEGLIYE
ncbi:YegJ family protein [Chryseobacterium gregarium]|uniref:YegJ family protein n=1 Tax=Chryseobacterium gregarium TaxID=456299 RepID=UPI00040DEFAD|nr:DUF2314 domain-containing protein [Chryseobacterium gregarium]